MAVEEEGRQGLGGDVSLRTSLTRSLLAQPDNPCKDNNQRDYQEMSRNGETRRTVELDAARKEPSECCSQF